MLEDSITQLARHCSMRTEQHLVTTIVRLAGEFDLACEPPFREVLGRVLDRHTETFLLDLRGLQFMDSTGFSMLVQIDALARRDDFDFAILCGDGMVRRVLKETGLDGMLPVVDPLAGLLPPSDSPV